MKLTQDNMRELRKQLTALQKQCDEVNFAARRWMSETGRDQYWAAIERDKLERRLTKFRVDIGEIYDFMGEKGLGAINGE